MPTHLLTQLLIVQPTHAQSLLVRWFRLRAKQVVLLVVSLVINSHHLSHHIYPFDAHTYIYTVYLRLLLIQMFLESA